MTIFGVYLFPRGTESKSHEYPYSQPPTIDEFATASPMVFGYVMGTVRGVVAWVIGYVFVVMLVVLGLENGAGIIGTAANIYITAHVIPGVTGSFEWSVFVPAAIIGIVGIRLGSSAGRGLLGRTKALLAGRGDSRSYRFKKAGKQLGVFGCGYLLATLVGAAIADVGWSDALVATVIMVFLVGVPATGIGVILAER